MKTMSWGWVFCALLLCGSVGIAKEKAFAPDISQIKDEKVWQVINADCEIAKEDGKDLVRMKPRGRPTTGSIIGMALVEGMEFTEGTIEIDLKGKGKVDRTFVGVAFNAVDGDKFEAVYFRPFNFTTDDQAYRSRAVQYVSWPDNTWEKLRSDTPGKYESAVKPIPDPSGWFHARIEVTKQKARVWVDDAKEPCLVVDRLTNRETGKVGLWVDSREGAFRNLKILPAK
jgi:3-keto-disaccharide hydrolase